MFNDVNGMVLHQNTKHIHIQMLVSPMTCKGWISHESLKVTTSM